MALKVKQVSFFHRSDYFADTLPVSVQHVNFSLYPCVPRVNNKLLRLTVTTSTNNSRTIPRLPLL